MEADPFAGGAGAAAARIVPDRMPTWCTEGWEFAELDAQMRVVRVGPCDSLGVVAVGGYPWQMTAVPAAVTISMPPLLPIEIVS